MHSDSVISLTNIIPSLHCARLMLYFMHALRIDLDVAQASQTRGAREDRIGFAIDADQRLGGPGQAKLAPRGRNTAPGATWAECLGAFCSQEESP